MEDRGFLQQDSASELTTNHRSGFPDCGFEPEPQVSVAPMRMKSRSLIYRLTHARPSSYLLVIVFFVILVIALIVALLRRTCAYPGSDATNGAARRKSTGPPYMDSRGQLCPYQDIRLPQYVIPVNYLIHLHPNLTSSPPAYTGWVKIETECSHPTNLIVLHSKNLTIQSVELQSKDQFPVSPQQQTECPELDELVIEMDRKCFNGEVLFLTIHFSGLLARRLDGFYLSEYKTLDGKAKFLGTTHMEPTNARRAFPCFDEPALKANFSLEMIRDANHKSLFNMPLLESIQRNDGLTLDRYSPSVKMSSYLVAFMILPNDYVFTSKRSQNDRVEINVYAPSALKNWTHFAVDVATKVLSYFEDYFGEKYPLPKLDMIAIPDFGAGAMENWGLITYRFLSLLYNPEGGQAQHMQSVAEVIAHEIAHQWFGNLVTMQWWNDLWLNEGFATYIQYLGAEHYNPNWKMMDQFYLLNYQQAMHFDCLFHSHPIPVPVTGPHEIESIFDDISYFKGASLLRMLENILGLESLKEGLRIYLHRFRYRNAVNSDLWDAIEEGYAKINPNLPADSPTRNLKRVMATWLEQMNFPLVAITRLSPTKIRMTQKRFLLYPNSTLMWKSEHQAPFNYKWSIPMKFITDTQRQAKSVWLNLETERVFTLENPMSWMKANYEQTGYFIVNYDEDMWRSLAAQLQRDHTVFPAPDRAGLINDACFLVRAGELNISIAMDLLSYLGNETDYSPWYTALTCTNYIKQMIYADLQLRDNFQKHMLSLITPVLNRTTNRFTWTAKDLTHMEILTRNVLFTFAIGNEDPQTVEKALRAFRQYKKTGKIEDGNLKNIVFSAGVTEGNREDWEFLWERYKETTQPQDKRSIQRALAGTRDSHLLQRLLIQTVQQSVIRAQDAVHIIQAISKSPVGRDLAWVFLRRNWAVFHQKYANQAFLMAELLKICSLFATEFDFETAQRFFALHEVGSGQRTSYQVLENMKSNIFWLKTNLRGLKRWLKTRYRNLD